VVVGKSEVMAKIALLENAPGCAVTRLKTVFGFCETLDLAPDADFPSARNDLHVAGHRILTDWFRSTLLTASIMR
jgi:hypothetical protein